MQDIEAVHCGAVIHATLQAYIQLMDATVEDALKKIASFGYGKTDTLGLDGIPETAIKTTLRAFDGDAVLVTEELGATTTSPFRANSNYPPTFYLSDPTDRSFQLNEFLRDRPKSSRIAEVMREDKAIAEWEDRFGKPASITGATSAITCIRHGEPIATAIVNFVTRDLFVASRPGVFRINLPYYSDLTPAEMTPERLQSHGQPVSFRSFQDTGASLNNMRYFVTFLGKQGYLENFRDSDLIRPDDTEKYLRYDKPGGPSRSLYLSTAQPADTPVGFVLANGEKIGEWIHWIPFVRFGKIDGGTQHSLQLYEIHQERPWTKDGILMSTPPPYSIFATRDGQESSYVIDVDKLRSFSDPSRVRSTLMVASSTNTWAIGIMAQHKYREIKFSDRRSG